MEASRVSTQRCKVVLFIETDERGFTIKSAHEDNAIIATR